MNVFRAEPEESPSPLVERWPAVVGFPDRASVERFANPTEVSRFLISCDHSIDAMLHMARVSLAFCGGCGSTFMAGGPGWRGR